MSLVLLASQFIYSVGYDDDTETMQIKFVSGNTYNYYGVPNRVHSGIIHAESAKDYFDENIRYEYLCKEMP